MDDANEHRFVFDPADVPEPDQVYANCLETSAMLGVEPVSREGALGLLGEWTEVSSGRLEPTTH